MSTTVEAGGDFGIARLHAERSGQPFVVRGTNQVFTPGLGGYGA